MRLWMDRKFILSRKFLFLIMEISIISEQLPIVNFIDLVWRSYLNENKYSQKQTNRRQETLHIFLHIIYLFLARRDSWENQDSCSSRKSYEWPYRSKTKLINALGTRDHFQSILFINARYLEYHFSLLLLNWLLFCVLVNGKNSISCCPILQIHK